MNDWASMLLDKIYINNFKSIKEHTVLNIKPITIFVGPNSAGKSVAINALKILAQSLQTSHKSLLSYTGKLLDAGDHAKTTFRGNKGTQKLGVSFQTTRTTMRDKITIVVSVTDEDQGLVKIESEQSNFSEEFQAHSNPLSVEHDSPVMFELSKFRKGNLTLIAQVNKFLKSIEFYDTCFLQSVKPEDDCDRILNGIIEECVARIATDNYYVGKNYIPCNKGDNWEYEERESTFPYLERRSQGIIISDNPTKDVNEYWHKYYEGKHRKYDDVVSIHNFLYLVSTAYIYSIDGVKDMHKEMPRISSDITYMLGSIVFVDNLRTYPQRYYTRQELKDYFYGKDVTRLGDNSNALKYVNYFLMALEMKYVIKLEEPSFDTFELVLEHSSGHRQNISDVGFGLSQLLPILIARSSSSSIMVIQQPELHLHPRAQTLLADIFTQDPIDVGNGVGNSVITYPSDPEDSFVAGYVPFSSYAAIDDERRTVKYKLVNQTAHFSLGLSGNNQFIIETHSEHFIRAIQLKVAEGIISNDDVCIYYVSNSDDGSTSIEDMPISKTGTIDRQWPGGFFEDGYNMSIRLLTAQ